MDTYGDMRHPEQYTFSGRFVKIRSIKVLVVSVIRVGSLMSCSNPYMSVMFRRAFTLTLPLDCKSQFRSPMRKYSTFSESNFPSNV